MIALIETKKAELLGLCKKYHVSKLSVFGSVVSGNLKKDSDIDFLVSFEEGLDPVVRGQYYWDLIDSFEKLFEREIDLVVESSMKNKFFIEEVNQTKQQLYVAA